MTATPNDPTDAARRWTEPGAHPVAPGIHRIPLPLPQDGLRAVNVYAVTAGTGTMIDAGWALEESRAPARAVARQLDPVSATSTGSWSPTCTGTTTRQAVAYAGSSAPGSASASASGRRWRMLNGDPSARPGRGCCAGRARPELPTSWRAPAAGAAGRPPWDAPTDWLTDGQTLAVGERVLRAVHTPGHTRGHLVFADLAGGLLFAGDHVLPHITPSIGFEPPDRVAAGRLPGSLATVRAMPDLRLLPAHGPVAPSVHARVDELVAHHDGRLAASGPRSGPAGHPVRGGAGRWAGPGTEHALDQFDALRETRRWRRSRPGAPRLRSPAVR